MAEPITEMYCENCGQRHVFGGQKPGGVARIRRVSRGLRSYVLNEAPTIGDAMADAWTRLEAEGTVRQIADLGATFSLCLECRRYVCHDCWNPAESLCRTCAPTAEDRLAAAAMELSEIVDRRPDEPRVEVLEVAPEVIAVVETVTAPAPEVIAVVETVMAPAPEVIAAVETEVAPEVMAVVEEPVAVVETVAATPLGSPEAIDPDVLAAALAAGFPVDVDQVVAGGHAAIAPPAAHPGEDASGPQRIAPAASAAPPDAGPAVRAGPLATPTLGSVTRAAPEARPTDVTPRSGGRHRRRPIVPTRMIPSPIRCRACGLHLPAAARFCRRCGVRQGVEA